MNAPKEFIDLVYSAENQQNYIGMGNPNARILIIGREPAHDLQSKKEDKKLLAEKDYERDQILNKPNWKNLIEDKPLSGVLWKGRVEVCNPRRPFPNQKCLRADGNNDGTATTWIWYQKLVDLILGREYDRRLYSLRLLDFHDFCFHTDISSAAAKNLATTNKDAKTASVEERSRELFSHPFFRQFPIVILGIGTDVGQYVSLAWCDKVLGFPTHEVEKAYNADEKEPMLWVNRDTKGHRILLHTQCLSQPSWEYITKIRDIIWSDGKSDFCWPKAY